jgi:hypothetical protein
VTAADLQRGGEVVASFKRSLVGELKAALERGAPTAIEVCNGKAPELAAALSREGVAVGRATRKPRNPNNRASGWTADALASFEARPAAELASAKFSRVLPDGKIGYAEPLVIQELCTNCHGTAIADGVKAELARLYPADEATGYAVGDLRGTVWVTLP